MGRWRSLVLASCAAMVCAGGGVARAAPATWAPRISIAAHGLNAVACPGVNLCIAVGNGGTAVSSTHPAGGSAAWSTAVIDGTHRILSLSCASAGFCAVTDNASRALTSSHPTRGPSAWHARVIDPGRWITGISCPTAHLCVAVDRRGGIVTSTHPTGGSGAWRRVQVVHTYLGAVSCASTSLCVVTENRTNKLLVSTRPTAGRGSWHQIKPGGQFTFPLDVSCPRVHACMLVAEEEATDLTFRPSTHPTSPGVWHPANDVIGYPHEGIRSEEESQGQRRQQSDEADERLDTRE